VFDNPILVGTVTILVVLVAVYLSYIAENGLPFVATYDVHVDVSDAAELTKNADVRIGGARVGQVLTISAETATKAWPHPFARLGLALNRNLDPLPPDTRYQVRLASVLGAKYVEILPGHLKQGGLPEGGTFKLNTNPRLNHNIPFVDLDTSFATFGPKTQHGLRAVLGELGPAFAGRGSQLNDAIHSLRGLMAPLEAWRVTGNPRYRQYARRIYLAYAGHHARDRHRLPSGRIVPWVDGAAALDLALYAHYGSDRRALREAEALAAEDGVAGMIRFVPGNAEAVPFPPALPVMSEGSASRATVTRGENSSQLLA